MEKGLSDIEKMFINMVLDDCHISYNYLYIIAINNGKICVYFLDNWTASTGFIISPSNNMSITVGMIVGTCVVLTIGVVIFIFISRCVKNISSQKY